MLTISIALLSLHWLADFVLQSDWMANNKSKDNTALLAHTLLYSLVFLPFYGASFALITFVLHTVTDYFTSRVNSRLWKATQVHWFFVSVGLDQLIHFVSLALTYRWLFGG